MPLFTFVGVMAACAAATQIAKVADMVVGVLEEKERIDDQVERLKKFKKSTFHTQTVVVSPEVKKDYELVGKKETVPTADMADDEYVDAMTNAQSAYVAEQKAKQDGREFEQACDRCHVCGAPDPHSKAAQHRMRQKMGVTGVSDTLVKAYIASKKEEKETGAGGWFDGVW